MTTDPPIDLARLTAEINEEVRRRRAAGDFPPGLERELDALFARYAPAGIGDDFDEVIDGAERSSFMHADAPTASGTPGFGLVKRMVQAVVGWYLRFLAQQVTAFAGAITRAVRLLGRRVDTLETATVRAGQRALAELGDHPTATDLSQWTAVVCASLAGVSGRVLHGECGEGSLVSALVNDGLDAYGIEPREALAVAGTMAGLDVRADDVVAHVRGLPDGSLGALVLSGTVDVLPLGSVLELIDLATRKLVSDGVIAVLSASPAAWARALDPVTADLAPGRPLHPETWSKLLVARGFEDPVVHRAGRGDATLALVSDETPGAEVLNANLERLNTLLFGPAHYALFARRS